MEANNKGIYECPAMLVVEVKARSCTLQMSQGDYNFAGLDEGD